MALVSRSKRFFLELPGCTVFQRDNTQIKTETNGTKCEMALGSSSKRFLSEQPGLHSFSKRQHTNKD